MNKINSTDEMQLLTKYIDNIKSNITSHNEYIVSTTSILTHIRTLHDQFVNEYELEEYNELKTKLMDNITQLINSHNNHNNDFNIDKQRIDNMRIHVTNLQFVK